MPPLALPVEPWSTGTGIRQQIIAVAVSYIRVVALTAGLISGRVFQGLGSGLPGLVLTSLRVVVISVPLAYLFARVLGLGLTWVWGAFATAGLVSSLVAVVWIQRRLWQLEGSLNTSGIWSAVGGGSRRTTLVPPAGKP